MLIKLRSIVQIQLSGVLQGKSIKKIYRSEENSPLIFAAFNKGFSGKGFRCSLQVRIDFP